jgi:hypothetical protein
MRVLYSLTACEVSPMPSDAAPEYLPLPMLLSEKLLEAALPAIQVPNNQN